MRRVHRTCDGAKAALEEMLGPSQSKPLLGDYLQQWLDETASPSLAPNTTRGYESVIDSLKPLRPIPSLRAPLGLGQNQ
jgi:hypothetical protein